MSTNTSAVGSSHYERLMSLDAFRGLIMFTLLCGGIFHSLKGHPIWNWLYLQNEHVEWVGCVYWDLIQPAFMFMVGVSMPFAFAKRSASGDSPGKVLQHVLLRAANLMLIGIALDHLGADRIQIGFIRVLQQIAIGYIFASFLVGKSLRTQALASGAILVIYQLVWMFNPWNGPEGPWARGNANLGGAFDLWMIGRNYSGHYVGLNAIPSTATILFGVMAGQYILATPSRGVACRNLAIAGVVGITAGWALGMWFPLIKRIWTPSFAVYAGGWTTLMLAGFFGCIDVVGHRKWAFPLVVVGSNSMAAYVLGNAFRGWFRSLTQAWIAGLKPILGDSWFPVFQSALFAIGAWIVLWWMYRRRIFLKA